MDVKSIDGLLGFRVLERLFIEVSKEMIMHMQKEERVRLPYIDALERATSKHEPAEPPFPQT
jgi:iron-sulfur cluster repair protein YtfE (RIC family)